MTHRSHASPHADSAARPGVRLDKWLWAARFFKTRSLATDEINRGRVQVNGQGAKASREVRIGDRISVRQGDCPLLREVGVLGLSELRGPAPVAQQLYEETPESQAARADWAANRRFNADPAQSIEQGRPTKQARRELADWQRWSASIDDA
ncbi:MAG: RNA-binding S4 domain-containing protein [Leptothrix sp. (in: b-proteobacteria)]